MYVTVAEGLSIWDDHGLVMTGSDVNHLIMKVETSTSKSIK
jgi:hypothetical protein